MLQRKNPLEAEREKLQKTFKINEYADEVRQNKKSLKASMSIY